MRSPEPRDLILPAIITRATRQSPRRPDRATQGHHPANHAPPSGRKHLSHDNPTPVSRFRACPAMITARCARRTPPAQRVQTEKSKIKTAFPTRQPIFTHARCARRAPRAQHRPVYMEDQYAPPPSIRFIPHPSTFIRRPDSPKFPRIQHTGFSPQKSRPASHLHRAPAQNKPTNPRQSAPSHAIKRAGAKRTHRPGAPTPPPIRNPQSPVRNR